MRNKSGKGFNRASSSLPSVCALLAMLIGLSVAGCQTARRTTPVENVSGDAFTDVLTFTGALITYADATGCMPDSKEALRDFCLKSCLPCASLDWSKFAWQQVNGANISVTYRSQGYTLPITMTIDPPSVHMGGRLAEELSRKLRELMEE